VSASDWLWLVGGTSAAGTVTYFSCVRPMLKGRGHCAPGTDARAAELVELRAERDALLALAQPSPEHSANS